MGWLISCSTAQLNGSDKGQETPDLGQRVRPVTFGCLILKADEHKHNLQPAGAFLCGLVKWGAARFEQVEPTFLAGVQEAESGS